MMASIAEDTLVYVLYPPQPLADKASCTSLAACIHEIVPVVLPELLWHRDPFQLKIAPDPDAHRGEDKNVLEGRMRVGDAVDDEWCVVWLLKELSKRWDIVVSVSDSDGEFLLIEAAESLPRWVKPSNATNRVWIHSDRLHLIPLSHVSSPSKPRKRPRLAGAWEHGDQDDFAIDGDNKYIAIDDALSLVRDVSVDTLAPKAVEDIVWQRISGYPDASRNHVHTTMVYLPVDIARALAVDKTLIQKPVETFYTRDALQLRAAHKMARFPPSLNALCKVKMTRTAYAQLLGQKFYPPKIFGTFKEREGTAAWRWRDVGMKLACGFEMLFQESKNRADVVKSTAEALLSSVEARKDALRRSPDYKTYLTRLVALGYFRDEIEGSRVWNELENKAVDIYVETRRDDDASRPSFAALFNAALSHAPEKLPDAALEQTEDSDVWMSVDANDFDEALGRAIRGGSSTAETQHMEVNGEDGEEDGNPKGQTEKLRDLATKVERFVEGKGNVEGAQFEDDAFSDEDNADSDDEDTFSDEKLSDLDDEESDADAQEIAEEARRKAMDNLVPALPASEYGQMPASFNTQRVAKTTVLAEQVDAEASGMGRSSSPTRVRPLRPPLLSRDKYEGVDSDDESSSSDPLAGGDDEDAESGEDMPQVVGEVEVDMEEEEAEFLEFSRQALGISDEMWENILEDRRGRGAFVPASATMREPTTAPKTTFEGLPSSTQDTRANANPNLNSFEAVMRAMDAELSRLRQSATPPTKKDKGKTREKPADVDVDMDIEASMQAELDSILVQEPPGELDEESDKPSMDYNLIKNFLESFKSQAGLSGPVGNLAGRLQPEWKLPRDES